MIAPGPNETGHVEQEPSAPLAAAHRKAWDLLDTALATGNLEALEQSAAELKASIAQRPGSTTEYDHYFGMRRTLAYEGVWRSRTGGVSEDQEDIWDAQRSLAVILGEHRFVPLRDRGPNHDGLALTMLADIMLRGKYITVPNSPARQSTVVIQFENGTSMPVKEAVAGREGPLERGTLHVDLGWLIHESANRLSPADQEFLLRHGNIRGTPRTIFLETCRQALVAEAFGDSADPRMQLGLGIIDIALPGLFGRIDKMRQFIRFR